MSTNSIKDSFFGIEKGLPPFLELLEELKIKADCFITGNICQRYPNLIKIIAEKGFNIGSHGMAHEQLWFKGYSKQYDELLKSTKIIESYSGTRPFMFRAPSFSATNNTLKALEKLNYTIDSSVMPGSVVKKFKGLLTIKSFKDAPRKPYHPSSKDTAKKGEMNIIEVPLTENPIFPSTPFGAGALNSFGINKMVKASETIPEDYIIFLIHPWELIDIGKYHPNLKQWVKDICSDNMQNYYDFFSKIRNNFEFANINDLIPVEKSDTL